MFPSGIVQASQRRRYAAHFRDVVARTPFFSRLPEQSCQAKEKRFKGITGSTRCVGPIIIDRQEEGFPTHDLTI